ncbi:hypothetical protein BW716_34180 [[Flexibacter] sp. ATCC 35208]|nr:hypothetical protein BW716_34180 [[Flexibacter] sp. ATCC 35208]
MLGKHLVEVKEIDSLIYKTRVVNKRYETETNIYTIKIEVFTWNNTKLGLFKFGSSTSHTNPHLSIMRLDEITKNVFIDGYNVDDDLNRVIQCRLVKQLSMKISEKGYKIQ